MMAAAKPRKDSEAMNMHADFVLQKEAVKTSPATSKTGFGGPGAYFAPVTNSRMEPRYKRGERVCASPAKPLERGCFVLLNTKTRRQRVIGRLLEKSETGMVLEQLNPPRQIVFTTVQIQSAHRIVACLQDLGPSEKTYNQRPNQRTVKEMAEIGFGLWRENGVYSFRPSSWFAQMLTQ